MPHKVLSAFVFALIVVLLGAGCAQPSTYIDSPVPTSTSPSLNVERFALPTSTVEQINRAIEWTTNLATSAAQTAITSELKKRLEIEPLQPSSTLMELRQQR